MLSNDIMTERLTLRCLDGSHATETYLAWMQNPDVHRYLESRFATHTIESLSEFISKARTSNDSYLFGIFTTADGIHRGNVKLGPIVSAHSSAAIGIIIGDPDVWGQGIATEAIAALSNWAFGELGLAKLWAGAYAANKGSVSAFQRNGYQIEGVQHSQVLLSNGERDDVILLGKVSP